MSSSSLHPPALLSTIHIPVNPYKEEVGDTRSLHLSLSSFFPSFLSPTLSCYSPDPLCFCQTLIFSPLPPSIPSPTFSHRPSPLPDLLPSKSLATLSYTFITLYATLFLLLLFCIYDSANTALLKRQFLSKRFTNGYPRLT